jgi:hypothetical protein
MARPSTRTPVYPFRSSIGRILGHVHHDQTVYQKMKNIIPPFLYASMIVVGIAVSSYFHLITVPVANWAFGYVGIFTLLVVFFYNQLSQTKNAKTFITQFLGSVAAKMFVTLIYLTIAFYTQKSWSMGEKTQLAITAFVAYIIFTWLLAKSKPIQES